MTKPPSKKPPGGATVKTGVAAAAELLAGLDPEHRDRLLRNVSERDSGLAERIEKQLYTFDDLSGLDDRHMEYLIGEVDERVLALALRKCTDDLRTRVLQNMTKKAGERLLETMAVQGPQKLSDVTHAQERVLETARKLEENGTIELKKPE